MSALIDGIRRLRTTSRRKAVLALGLHAETWRLAAAVRFLRTRAAKALCFVDAAPCRHRLSSDLMSMFAPGLVCDAFPQAGATAACMPAPTQAMSKSEAAVAAAADYVRAQGIFLPRFALSAVTGRFMGGARTTVDKPYRLRIGTYPTSFLRRWFAMHELGHLLWAEHAPLRSRVFRRCFGEPLPRDYDDMPGRHSWKTVVAGPLSRFPGPHRPKGEPSWYGAIAGGEERFCELIALMYANYYGFDAQPPPDLAELWNACSRYGLSRMMG